MGKGGALSDTARAVRVARAWADMTQAELAQRVMVRPETVSLWESGKTEPSSNRLKEIGKETGSSRLLALILWDT